MNIDKLSQTISNEYYLDIIHKYLNIDTKYIIELYSFDNPYIDISKETIYKICNIKTTYNVKGLNKAVYLNDLKRYLKFIIINPHKIILLNSIHNNIQYIGTISIFDDKYYFFLAKEKVYKSEIMIAILGNKETILF